MKTPTCTYYYLIPLYFTSKIIHMLVQEYSLHKQMHMHTHTE